jgi:hypothetical protein
MMEVLRENSPFVGESKQKTDVPFFTANSWNATITLEHAGHTLSRFILHCSSGERGIVAARVRRNRAEAAYKPFIIDAGPVLYRGARENEVAGRQSGMFLASYPYFYCSYMQDESYACVGSYCIGLGTWAAIVFERAI